MPAWDAVTAASPALAGRVRSALDAHLHKVLATLRADGSPRVSGTEVDFRLGEVWLGSMPGAVKVRDLQRDGRFAIHSAPADETLATPDVKLAGIAVEVVDDARIETWRRSRAAEGREQPPGPFHLFRLDVRELVATSLGDPPDHLVIESWSPARGTRRLERR